MLYYNHSKGQDKADEVGESWTKNARQEPERIRKARREINLKPPASCSQSKRKGDTHMSKKELCSQIKNLRELTRMADELNAEIEAAKDSIKALR